LYLDDCAIAYALRFGRDQHASLSWDAGELEIRHGNDQGYMYPSLRWRTILPLLSTRLTHLQRFGMAHGPWDCYEGEWDQAFAWRYELPARLEVERYCVHDAGTGPTHWMVGESMRNHGRDEAWDEKKVERAERECEPGGE
jgi:hypothetical protein